jgi:predicted nuclease of predicted toxin-antitoxin system
VAAPRRVAPRLLLDECIWKDLARRMRERGFDVIHAIEAECQSMDDEELLTFSTEQGRVLLTANNKDFARLAHEWHILGKAQAGIVLSNQLPPGDAIITSVSNLLRTQSAGSLRNTVRYLSEFRELTAP